ncbi:MAG TPA: TetR family transcriptional regulator, partial [Spirochaetia bacterium]|nr:TetR family transcriptional regulator [Spirochaetia bacterium]
MKGSRRNGVGRPARSRPPRGRPARGSAEALTRQRIVAAALQIVDAEGLAALSMRRLGASLGVDPMAVYYHLPNKAALYDAIVEAVMAEAEWGEGPAGQAPAP